MNLRPTQAYVSSDHTNDPNIYLHYYYTTLYNKRCSLPFFSCQLKQVNKFSSSAANTYNNSNNNAP